MIEPPRDRPKKSPRKVVGESGENQEIQTGNIPEVKSDIKNFMDSGPKSVKKDRTGLKKAKIRCKTCDSSNNLHRHHIIPKFRDGTDEWNNIVILCNSCHRILHELLKLVGFDSDESYKKYSIKFLELEIGRRTKICKQIRSNGMIWKLPFDMDWINETKKIIHLFVK